MKDFVLTGDDLEIIMIGLAYFAEHSASHLGDIQHAYEIIRKIEGMYEVPDGESYWDKRQ